MSIFSLILALVLPPIGVTRHLDMQELANCKKKGTLENPVLVYSPSGVELKLRYVSVSFTNSTEVDLSQQGVFSLEGVTLENKIHHWGAVTQHICTQNDAQNGDIIDCNDDGVTRGILTRDYSEGKMRYIATQHFDEARIDTRKVTFNEEECSFWPHKRPQQTGRVVLYSMSVKRYCAHAGPVLFKIKQNENLLNPLKIEFGNAYSNCVVALLNSPANDEYWMDAHNEFGGSIIDPAVFKNEQKFDFDGDGDLDLIKVEKDLPSDPFPDGSWSFVLYRE